MRSWVLWPQNRTNVQENATGACLASVKHKVLYHMADEHPISEVIRERQLQFNRHCLRMPKDEPTNIFVIYQNKVRQCNCHGNSGLTYFNQISKYLSTDKTIRLSVEELVDYIKEWHLCNLNIAMHKFPTQ